MANFCVKSGGVKTPLLFYFRSDILKGCKILLACGLLVCLLLGGCGAKEEVPTTTAPQTTTAPITTAAPTTTTTTTAPAPETTQPATIVFSDEVYTVPEKSGDMLFTDDPNNKFIQAVVSKYGVDASLLACIYKNPSSDSNFVWQFNGQTDTNGKPIRNASTLKYVYSISADCNTIARTGGLTGNDGMSLAAGVLLMQTTKQLMIPEFQDQLNA